MASVRKVRTASGAVAVQVVRKHRRQRTTLAHVGSAHTDAQLGILLERACRIAAEDQGVIDIKVPCGPSPSTGSPTGGPAPWRYRRGLRSYPGNFTRQSALNSSVTSLDCVDCSQAMQCSTSVVAVEGELTKIFANVWHYIQFATANQFFMIATDFGIDFYRIHDGLTRDYPRMAGLPKSGFAAGPRLFKDTMQLAAATESRFMLGHAAMLINEGLPDFIVHLWR